ncbi:carbohydrate-binding module family 50 protein [Serendipita vermifera MAFF 305830]|uniref:Carbohydrate-binding module family 50 protein n=1 Tax=Serendipita vermifera MAFF 305830 TaxID=933852 RepID=A0A0C2XTJ4_SERVB|nr:carbohydrate-binding module family 50 protein [Serendipita vermifera MAFF 305830]
MPSRPDRWSQYDEPSYRTGGMERVGYDADTERYYFQEGTELYEGEPGAEFGGQLRHVGQAPRQRANAAAESNKLAWRQLAPFLLIVGVVLLLFLKMFLVPSSPVNPPATRECPQGLVTYEVVSGDSCWSIADGRGWTLEKLSHANPGLSCEPLSLGTTVCVPVKTPNES